MNNNNNNNKQPNVYVPTREEFDEFCARGMKLDDKEWIDAIWNLVSKVGWKKKNGEAPNHWQPSRCLAILPSACSCYC